MAGEKTSLFLPDFLRKRGTRGRTKKTLKRNRIYHQKALGRNRREKKRWRPRGGGRGPQILVKDKPDLGSKNNVGGEI